MRYQAENANKADIFNRFFPAKLDDELWLKPLKTVHSDSFFNFVIKNREYLGRFDPFVTQHQKIEDVQRDLTRIQKRYEAGKTISCGIWENDRFIGYIMCGLNWRTKFVHLGYAIAEDYQGRGIVTRAAQLMLTYAFSELGMRQAWLTCWTNNASSIRVAERLGFKREAQIIPADPNNDHPHDEYKYTLNP